MMIPPLTTCQEFHQQQDSLIEELTSSALPPNTCTPTPPKLALPHHLPWAFTAVLTIQQADIPPSPARDAQDGERTRRQQLGALHVNKQGGQRAPRDLQPRPAHQGGQHPRVLDDELTWRGRGGGLGWKGGEGVGEGAWERGDWAGSTLVSPMVSLPGGEG